MLVIEKKKQPPISHSDLFWEVYSLLTKKNAIFLVHIIYYL